MKKKMWAPILAAAILVGPSVLADDWVLPSGEVLPLGKEITVWTAHNGYFGNAVEKFLADPDVANEVMKGFLEESGLFQKGEESEARIFSDTFIDLLQRSRVYQLRTTKKDIMHTAIAVSIPCDLKLTEEEKEDFLARAATKSMEMEDNQEILDTAKDFNADIKDTSEKSGKSHGVTYKSGKVVMTPEFEHMKIPMFLYWLSTTKNDKTTVTFIFANQTAGKVFESMLNRAVEDVK